MDENETQFDEFVQSYDSGDEDGVFVVEESEDIFEGLDEELPDIGDYDDELRDIPTVNDMMDVNSPVVCRRFLKDAQFNPTITPPLHRNSFVVGQNFQTGMTGLDIFQQLVTTELMNEVTVETNRYVGQIKSVNPSAMPRWKDVEEGDLWRFFALNLLMGLVQKPSIKDYWSKDENIDTPIFRTVMSRNRFEEILRGLHFVDNATLPARLVDRFGKLGNFFNTILKNMKSCVQPGEYICVDESLLLFKGRLSFKQYIPSKRYRFGIKFFMLVDCESKLILNIIPYMGKNTPWSDSFPRDQFGVGGIAVLNLVQDHFFNYHKLVIDNWFSSIELATELLNKGMYVFGTVRKNRKGMPKMTPAKLSAGEVQVYSNEIILIERWSDRREVIMLNTFIPHEMKHVNTTNPQNARLKPASVLIYNKKMGAVDDVDRVISPYENLRKTIKWYKKVAFRKFKWAVYQSYRLFLILNPTIKITYKKFIQELVCQILKKYPKSSPAPVISIVNQTPQCALHLPEKIVNAKGYPMRSHCYYCKMQGINDRKETAFRCSACQKRLCINGRESCFKLYHQEILG